MKVQIIDVTRRWSKTRPLNGEGVRFAIGGGDFRLVVAIHFEAQALSVRLFLHTRRVGSCGRDDGFKILRLELCSDPLIPAVIVLSP